MWILTFFQTKDWWTYEFCYGRHIKQYHLEGGKQENMKYLGHFESQMDWTNKTHKVHWACSNLSYLSLGFIIFSLQTILACKNSVILANSLVWFSGLDLYFLWH